jgi:hypothetical protein
MDSGAQQDTPNTDANASGIGTTKDAGAGDKSAGIDKGKAPELPEVWTNPVLDSRGQATPTAPEQPNVLINSVHL